MKQFNYLGFKPRYLDSIECRLTYKGADTFDACGLGRHHWRKLGKRKIFTIDELFSTFETYHPSQFVASALERLLDYLCDFHFKRYESLKTDHAYSYSDLTDDTNNLKVIKRYLKAAIIMAVEIKMPYRSNHD